MPIHMGEYLQAGKLPELSIKKESPQDNGGAE